MKKKYALDWWMVTGVIEMVVGIVGVLSRVNTDALAGALVLGAVQMVFGVALMQKSKLVFWLGLIMAGMNLLSVLNNLAKGSIDTSLAYMIAIMFVGVRFAAYVMLYQQIRAVKIKKV